MMISTLKKEECTVCSGNINIGQKICVCCKCDVILHANCVSKSHRNRLNSYSYYCNNCFEPQYVPFPEITSRSDSDKFYDQELVDLDDSAQQIASLLQNCSSYAIETVDKQFKSIGKNFSCYFLNIDGNLSNFDSLSVELQRHKHKFSAIGLAETNTDQCNGQLYQLPGYTACYQNKMSGKLKGSGVALYIKSEINFVIEEKLSRINKNIECIFVRTTNTTEPYLIGSVYRPPSGDITEFISELESILLDAVTSHSFVMGDYNIDLLKDSSNRAAFESVIFSSGFSPTISTATHLRPGSSSSCIDNILVNRVFDIASSGTISENLLHHRPIFVFSQQAEGGEKSDPEVLTQYYEYSNDNIDRAVDQFSNKFEIKQLVKFCGATNSIGKAFDRYVNTFQSSLEDCCRLKVPKTSKRNQVNNPWFTPGLRNAVEKRHRLFKEWKSSMSRKSPDGNAELREKFKTYRLDII